MKSKIIIIDDHSHFRESLQHSIEQFNNFEVVGTAGDSREGEKIAMQLKPDLAVIDLSLPDKSGIQLTRILKTILPDLTVIIVSMHSKIHYILGALQAGALGYLVKESVSKTLFDCLESTLKGEYYLDAALSGEIATKLLDTTTQQVDNNNSAYGALSPREQQVMRLLAQGEPTKDIAEKLSISPKTVANHRANIMTKLNIHNSAGLVRYAARLGLLEDAL
jgi:DNA-binding NarL/FixJ family response regulator